MSFELQSRQARQLDQRRFVVLAEFALVPV